MAQAFTAAITFGEHSVSPDLLLDSLMLYLSPSERDLLSTALQEALVGDDEDELLDLMDRMGVRTAPTQENLKAVFLQVAHEQIIQQPKYALDNIAAVAGPALRKFFPSVLEMQKMYDDLKPTTRKVLKLITASPATPAENQSLRFSHQYIRGLDEIGLRKILRFVTGSDVICVKDIGVIFTGGQLHILVAQLWSCRQLTAAILSSELKWRLYCPATPVQCPLHRSCWTVTHSHVHTFPFLVYFLPGCSLISAGCLALDSV